MWPSNHYLQVAKDEEVDKRVTLKRNGLVTKMTALILCFLGGAAGYLAAQIVVRYVGEPGSPPVDTVFTTFSYNRSFSYPPSNETNRAWREIFPKEGGFFVHPTIAPTRSTFSVFHQLHCLNGLRVAYFANAHAAQSGQLLFDDDLPVDLQMSHMRHYIDLLRQVLMCHADTTLEVVGVHGFRTPHVCKDWDQLRDWTSLQQQRQHVEQIV